MTKLIDLPTHRDERGFLTVLQKVLPFSIERLYYLYNVTGQRGGHRHKKTHQAFICLNGSCFVFRDNGRESETVVMSRPDQLLFVPPEDWHTMEDFSPGAVLLVLASHPYDPSDYIHEPYRSSDDRV